jgi:hypothetical protein
MNRWWVSPLQLGVHRTGCMPEEWPVMVFQTQMCPPFLPAAYITAEGHPPQGQAC